MVGVALYCIQNKGQVGNCALWWRDGAHGYTCNLNEAWRVSEDKAERICAMRYGQDVMWPADMIDAMAVRHVDVQGLPKEQK